MCAEAERQVLVSVGAADVVCVGVWELCGVPVGRTKHQEQVRGPGHGHPTDVHRMCRPPPPGDHRGVESQYLFDRARNQARVGAQLLPGAAVLEEPPEGVPQQVRRRFVACDEKAERDRRSLHRAQAVALPVAGQHQVGGEVVTGVVDTVLDQGLGVAPKGQ